MKNTVRDYLREYDDSYEEVSHNRRQKNTGKKPCKQDLWK